MWDILLGGILGGGLGGGLGAIGSKKKQPDIGQQITDLVNTMNDTVLSYAGKAIASNDEASGRGVTTLQNYLKDAIGTQEKYLQKGTIGSQMQSMLGYNQAKANFMPTIQAGNNARDTWMDTLGISRPVAGSDSIYQAQTKAADEAMYNYFAQSNTQNAPKAVNAPGAAPLYPSITQDDLSIFLTNTKNDSNSDFYRSVIGQLGEGAGKALLQGGANPEALKGLASAYLINQRMPTYNQQMSAYNQQKAAYDKYQQQAADVNAHNAQIQSFLQLLQGGQ